MRKTWLAALIFAVLSGYAVAGTINLRSGSASFDSPVIGDGPVHLVGNRHFELDAFAELAFLSIVDCSFGCAPGETTSLDMRVNGNDLPARVELDGVLYNDVGDLNSLNQFEITFSGQTTVPRLKRERNIQRVPVTYEMTFWHGPAIETMTGNAIAIITWQRYEDFWTAGSVEYKIVRN